MKSVIETLHDVLAILGELWPLCASLFVVLVALIAYFRSRKQILFESWVNMYDSKDSDLGRSLADLLLFKIGTIKNTHTRSTTAIGTWNLYRDVPAFREGLDDDVKLLGSVELGKYGSAVSTFLMIMSRVVPIMFRPARLKGSIHKHGEKLRLLASLEHFAPKHRHSSGSYLWEVVQEKTSPELLPDAVEQLAFRIYLDLTGEDLFKTWEAFRVYTLGLAAYISYVELQRECDFETAKNYYSEALELEPNNPAIKYSLGVLEYHRWEERSNETAMVYFRGALACSQPRLRAYAHSGLANALLQRYHRFNIHDEESLRDAIYHANRAVSIDPDLDIAHKALAFAYHMLGEQRALEPNPAVEGQHGAWDSAIKHYRRAYELNKHNYIAHNNLANLYVEWAKRDQSNKERNKHLAHAVQQCEMALAISPQYFHAHDNLGNAYLERGELEKAYECFKSALRYRPDYPEAMNDLALLFLEETFQRKSVPEAIRYHLDAVSLVHNSDPQRKKLCDAFVLRWRLVSEKNGYELEENLRHKLIENHCLCVEPARIPEGTSTESSRT
jgi:tetratricopeptide (TPR) repeat protein